MNYVSRLAIAFAPAIPPSSCRRNRMALIPRHERTIEGVTS
jgi:hypothetical protein